MSVAVRVYRNSGFSEHDIPDSIELLDSCSHFDTTEALVINDIRAISEIHIKCSNFNDVKTADYVLLRDITNNDIALYPVINPHRYNSDTVILTLGPMDYINTYGGIRNLQILDGITERVHCAAGEDVYGAFDEDDPLMTPIKPLQVLTEWHTPGNGYQVYIESTLDPKKTANTGRSKKFDVSGDSDAWVCVPEAVPISLYTDFKISGQSNQTNRGTAMFNASDADVKSAVATLRSLGLEQAIVSQTKFPTAFVEFSNYLFEGKSGSWNSSFNFIQHSSAKNNRLNYANYEKYGIITCAGDSCEYEPAALYNGANKPVIDYKADPNPDGKPYFRYKTVNKNNEFWRNCLSGMTWKQVPLMFTGKSGSAIDTARFQNQSEIAKEQQQVKQDMNAINMGLQTISGMSQVRGGDVAGGLLGFGANMLGGVLTNAQNEINYNQQRRSELLDFTISQNLVVPTVNFPYNSDGIRDLKNNGILEYRYVLADDEEVRRIDRLLTMYGYKITRALRKEDFTSRRYFNFVKCKNIAVTGHSRWINMGIENQLRDAVRVWHVLPSAQYYDNNPAV